MSITKRHCPKHGEHDDFILRGTHRGAEAFFEIIENEGRKITYLYKNCFCMKCVDEWLDKGVLEPMTFLRRQPK